MTWELRNLGQFCSLVNGKAFKVDDWSESGLPIIRIQNLNDSTKPFNHWDGSLDRQVQIQKKDLLIAWSGTPGTSFGAHIWNGPEGVLNQHIFRVDLTNNEVTKEWLKFCVNIQLLRLIDKAHGGVGLKHVTKGAVEAVQIPLPPLAEQKRIAGILDAADKLRAKRRESLARLDTLLQSTFLDLFGDPVTNPMGWEFKPLAYGVESFEGGKNLTPTDIDRPDSVRVLKVSAVTSGEYRPDQSKAFSSEEIVQSSHMVKKGDLLISRANTAALVGAVCHVWDTVGLEMLPDKLWRFIWNDSRRIEPLYMLHLARSDYFREQLIQRATGTSGSMKNIGKKKMLEIPIPYPPLNLQHHFATIVESVEQQKTSQRAHLAELDTLFAALQQRAFNGEL